MNKYFFSDGRYRGGGYGHHADEIYGRFYAAVAFPGYHCLLQRFVLAAVPDAGVYPNRDSVCNMVRHRDRAD